MKKTVFFFILALLFVLLLTACENNVYIPEKITPENVWEVQNNQFYKFSEALDFYLKSLDSKSITDDDVITLLRDVPESERGEAIIIPDTFPDAGNLRVDFNNHEYWFEDNLEYFFEIRNGETIEIVNGTTVIDVPANPVPMALVVNTKTVTIDDHLIDDRRPVPKALEVQEKGIVKIQSSGSLTETALKGEVKVSDGGELGIESGSIEATTLTASGDVTIRGGSITVETLNTDEDTTVAISQKSSANPTNVTFSNVIIQDTSSVLVYGGTSTFYDSVDKAGDSEFKVYNGKVFYTHSTTEEVEQAIIDGAADPYTGGQIETELIHSWGEWITVLEPTCTEDGQKMHTCLICGAYEYSSIPALGHDYVINHDAQHHWNQCTKCNHIEEGSVQDHSWDDWEIITQPTCTTAGEKKHICPVCGEVGIEAIAPLGHNWETTWSAEKHWHECTRCGLREDEEEHEFTVLFFAETLNSIVCITGCEKCGYSASSSSAMSATGAFALIQSVNGLSAVKTDAVHWTISVSEEIKNTYASCKWFNANQSQQLENTTTDFAPITLSVAVDEQIDWIRIYCLYYDINGYLVSGGYVFMHK